MIRIPPSPRKNSLIDTNGTHFLEYQNEVWQFPVADDMEPREKHPYKKARLVHHNHDLKKRWYVLFYAWDISKEKLVRKRLFEPINREHKLHRRLQVAEDVIRQVNFELYQGKVLGKGDPLVNNARRNVLKLSILTAVDFVGDQKKITNHRQTYTNSFQRLRNNLERWLEYDQRKDFPLRNFTPDDAFSFFEYLNRERKVSNKTFNNYRTDLAIVFNFLMKRNPNLFTSNPALVIDKLPVNARKHAALSDEQMDKIIKACRKAGYHSLVLFIQMIYYTFGRPEGEVIQLKIENIDLANNRILFPAHISKGKTDDYVGLSPALKAILQAMDLNKYPPGYYLFGQDQKPGEKRVGYLYFYNRNRKIFEQLGLDKASMRYSVYSYKHSGVISLYKATKDIKLVQSQCRHKGLEQTNSYLRDLGTLSNYDGLQKWDGAV